LPHTSKQDFRKYLDKSAAILIVAFVSWLDIQKNAIEHGV